MRMLLLVLSVLLVLVSASQATTYYVDQQVSAGNTCQAAQNSTTPMSTIQAGAECANPGDTVLVANGPYPAVSLDCTANARSGTAGAPITLKAMNERQARISSNGTVIPFYMTKCRYWTIEGFTVESADTNNSGGAPDVVQVFSASNLVFRRNLIWHNNRYVNGSCVDMIAVSQSLMEENEIYECTRNVFSTNCNISPAAGFACATGNTMRRNYINTRNWPVPSDVTDINAKTGQRDVAFNCYPCDHLISENNIAEDTNAGFDGRAVGPTFDNNKYLGNLVNNSVYGHVTGYDGGNIINLTITDFVSVSAEYIPLYILGAQNVHCDQCSILNPKTDRGILYGAGFNVNNVPSYAVSAFMKNVLMTNVPVTGIFMANQSDFLVDHAVLFNTSPLTSPAGDSRFQNVVTTDPQIGTCRAWLPDSSPLKGTGAGGADPGARVLYRYQDGVLTTQRLWNDDGSFTGCGAIVPGLNDVAGSSCRDLHTRFNINTNGCPFPAGYGTTPPPSSQSPVAWWKLDAGSGTTGVDEMANAHPGTLTGSPLPTWVTGHVGPFALQFTSGASFQATPLITGLTKYTWTMWFKGDTAPSTTTTLQPFFHGHTAANFGFSWSHTTSGADQAALQIPSSGPIVRARITSPLSAGVWYHLGATYDGNNLRMFLNGQLQATTPVTSMQTPSGSIAYGLGVGSSIDDPKIWDRDLSAAEMLQEYGHAAAVPRHKTMAQ